MARALLVVAVTCALLEARAAHACSPGWHAAGVTETHPSEATHPANAAIILVGGMLQPSRSRPWGLQATVDGVAVEISPDETLSYYFPPDDANVVLALRLTPEPMPGQTVRLWGDACVSYALERCPVDLTYTATVRDDTPPPPPTGWWDYQPRTPWGDPWSLDSCSRYPELGSARGEIAIPMEALPPADRVYARVTPVPRSSAYGEVSQWVGPVEAVSMTIGASVDVTQVGDPPDPTRFCIEVELVDAAGNGAGAVRLCPMCRIDRNPRWGEEDWCYPDARHCPMHLAPASPAELCTPPMADAGVGASVDAGPDAGSATIPDTSPPHTDAALPTLRDAGAGHTGEARASVGGGGGCCSATRPEPHWPLALLFFAAALRTLRRSRGTRPRTRGTRRHRRGG